jgi:hypothetical protein
MLWGVGMTTVSWILVAYVTPATEEGRLREFYRRIQPGGPGWNPVLARAARDGLKLRDSGFKSDLPAALMAAAASTMTVWALLFAGGYMLYGQTGLAMGLLLVAGVGSVIVARCWRSLSFR